MNEEKRNSQNNLEELSFNGIWRSYQQRVLDELDIHLNDKKLNVVAAPGAGKTILGIEVIKRLNKPALILTPTITIKKQWEQRIKTNFLSSDNDTGIISTEINEIKKLTITTYQALHSLSKKEKEFPRFLKELKDRNIGTILFDEAHHLRTEWYKTLINLLKRLEKDGITSVSLTATPPYDVSINEWQNYNQLCGCVDAEISIPELVKNKNLCPHQDLIYFCNLSKEEENNINEYHNNRDKFFNYLKNEADFNVIIKTSNFLNDLGNNIEIIYEDTQFSISITSYLFNEDEISKEAYYLSEYLGLTKDLIPQFDYKQAEILFNGILGDFKEFFPNTENIKAILKKLKLLRTHSKVDFTGESRLKNVFSRSIKKLEAIKEITKSEYSILKEQLREVILLDYIGKGDSLGLNIYSVFEELKNTNIELGILTGTLIVIPKSAKNDLDDLIKQFYENKDNILTADFNKDYFRIETYGNTNIVQIITELFRLGKIKVLIGTQALLGEGWDAPCTNTLIIASTIGSYMSSNQMRGRALRIDPENQNKNANIWHLVAMYDKEFNSDFETILKRFNSFEGISYINNNIQNGLERLGIPEKYIEENKFNEINKIMFNRAINRENLKERWKQVFLESNITEKNIIHQLYSIIESETNSIPNILIEQNASKIKKLFNSKIEKHYIKIIHDEHFALASGLYKTLYEYKIINNPNATINITIDRNTYSSSITLTNCTNYERNIFIKSFNEIFTPNEKSRYIIKKDSNYSLAAIQEKNFFKIFNFLFSFKKREYLLPECILKKDKYYFIPEVLGTKRTQVETLLNFWKEQFGYIDAIYTRNPQGRKELLRAIYSKEKYKKTKISRKWI